MCLPAAATAIAPQIMGAVGQGGLQFARDYFDLKSQSKNLQYKAQIALNNANTLTNEARRQQQIGIDLSRKEKIEGLKQASTQAARNSAGGFDMSSLTSMQNYNDTIDKSNSNANDIKNEYNLKANEYFNRANEYKNQVKEYQSDYKASLYNAALNSLGSVGKVAGSWYQNAYNNRKGM